MGSLIVNIYSEFMVKKKVKGLFAKVDSVILRNYYDYWMTPLINKYFEDDVCSTIEGFMVLRKGKKPIWISHPFNYAQVKRNYSNKLIYLLC